MKTLPGHYFSGVVLLENLLYKIQTVGFPALVAIVVFGVLIAVHEYGHFLAARLCKVPVEEYAIGFGKKLIQWRKGETLYRINLVPLGGYCRIIGMNPEEEDFDHPKGFNRQNGLVRFAILFGGPFFNLVLGFLLAVGIFSLLGKEKQMVSLSPIPHGPSARAGLKDGDLVLALNGKEVTTVMEFVSQVQESGGQPLKLRVLRPADASRRVVRIEPEKDTKTGQFRIQAHVMPQQVMGRTVKAVFYKGEEDSLQAGDTITSVNGVSFKTDLQFSAFMATAPFSFKDKPARIVYRDQGGAQQVAVLPLFERVNKDYLKPAFLTAQQYQPMPFPAAVRSAMDWPVRLFVMQFQGIASIFQGRTQDIGGPVAILGQVAQSARSGLYEVLWISALLNFAIGFFNLLPVPALDGGRISVVVIESLIRRRMNPIWEARLHTAGFLLLVGLILLVSVQDFRNLLF